jgi:DNA-binding GntR family transcriptional regulator
VVNSPPPSVPARDQNGARLNPVVRAPAKERVSDRVYEELSSAIRDLRLEPGALLSETDLSLKLGVSRTPLREAISKLVDRGLVTVVAQVGTRVALIDLGEVKDACFIRGALEAAAFREACGRADSGVAGLRSILERQRDAVDHADQDAFFVTDEELHQEVFRLSGHPEVWSLVQRSKLQVDRMRRLILPEAVATHALLDEHTRIAEHLAVGDVKTGTRLITDHCHAVLTKVARLRSTYPGYFTS